MKKSEIALRANHYNSRIEALKVAVSRVCGIVDEDNLMTLQIMLTEYFDKLESLSNDKEYMISFENGGWNTTYATNDEDALKFAKAEYDGEYTKVASVRLSTPDGMEAALRSFY